MSCNFSHVFIYIKIESVSLVTFVHFTNDHVETTYIVLPISDSGNFFANFKSYGVVK